MRIGENIASEFNEFSVNYTNDMIACVPHYLKLLASFTKNLPEKFRAGHILDLGCGNGNTTATLLKFFPKAHYELLDASEKMIDLCRDRFKDNNTKYTTKYFKDFEFNDGFYDMITAGFSLHHCDANEKRALFRSINKALKKEGIFGFSDLMIDTQRPEHSELLTAWKTFVLQSFPDGEKWEWLMEHYREFDKPNDYRDQITWLEAAGFNDIRIIFQEGHWVHIRAIKG